MDIVMVGSGEDDSRPATDAKGKVGSRPTSETASQSLDGGSSGKKVETGETKRYNKKKRGKGKHCEQLVKMEPK